MDPDSLGLSSSRRQALSSLPPSSVRWKPERPTMDPRSTGACARRGRRRPSNGQALLVEPASRSEWRARSLAAQNHERLDSARRFSHSPAELRTSPCLLVQRLHRQNVERRRVRSLVVSTRRIEKLALVPPRVGLTAAVRPCASSGQRDAAQTDTYSAPRNHAQRATD